MLGTVIVFCRFLVGWLFTLAMGAAAWVLAIVKSPDAGWLACRRPWGRIACKIVGVKVVVEGAEHMQQPCVFVINHQSLIDVVAIPGVVPPKARFVAKKELRYIPIFGWGFATGAVFIDRSKPRQAVQSIREGLSALPPDWSLVVFPEGTRSDDGKLKPFKKGAMHIAIEGKRPIVPIGLAGGRDIIPKGAWLVRPGVMHVTVGEPIDTTGWRSEDIDIHTAQVHEAVARCVQRSELRHKRLINQAPVGGRSTVST